MMRRRIWAAAVMLCVSWVPGVIRAQLPEHVTQVLSALNIEASQLSVVIRDVDADEVVLSHLPTVPRNPASVMKLVATWSALEMLGPAYVWPTEVYFLGDFDGSVLNGDLAFKGFGDPFLVQEEFWKLLRALRRTGLQRIEGDFVFDDSYFDVREPSPGAFDEQPSRTYNVVPNALLMNFKAVQFQFRPSPFENKVNVTIEPPLPNLDIENRIGVHDKSCGGYQRGTRFNVAGAASANRVVLEGNFSRHCRVYSMRRTVLTHETYAYGLFRTLWGEVGGSIDGSLRREEIDELQQPAIVWSSRPLAEILRSINKNSNNVMTRQLVYTIGAETMGAPGTRENGVAAIEAFLGSRGLDIASLRLINGAGLARDGRISAALLTDLLIAALDSPYAAEFVASLSIGGIDGTTRGRFNARSGSGRLHVKTGRVDHVSALSGYVHADDGRDYAVAILLNATDAHRGLGQEVEEAVLTWLISRETGAAD